MDGEWIRGRRAEDEAVLPATTHTICEDCLADLQRIGLIEQTEPPPEL